MPVSLKKDLETTHLSEEKFDWLFKLSRDLLCVVGFDGHFKQLNPAWEKLLGLTQEDLEGQTIIELVHPDDRETMVSAFQTLLAGMEVPPFEVRFRSKSGVYLSLCWTTNPSSSHKAIFASASDAAAEFKAAARRHRHLFETSKDGLMVVLAETGEIREVNQAVLELAGYRADELIGKHVHDLALFEGDEAARVIMEEIRQSKVLRRETVIYTKIGTAIDVELLCHEYAGNTRAIIQFNFRDISDRKAAEQAIRDSESRFQFFVDAVRDYALFTLDPDGRIFTWNSGAEHLLQYRESDVLGRHFEILFTQEDQRVGLPQAKLMIASSAGTSVDNGWHVRQDGSRIYVEGVLTAVYGAGGRLRGFTKLMQDVTMRRETEEALRRAAKLESIGVLAAGIAHDFNNLLVGVMGGISFAIDSLTAGHPAFPMLELAKVSSESAADLTRQLLAYAGKGRFIIRPTDLSKQVYDILDLVRTSVTPKVQLSLSLAERLPLIEADPSQIQQILMNLVINAQEAIGDREGFIAVSTGTVKLTSGEILANADLAGIEPRQYVYLQVSDTGIGMTLETRRKIFDPFFTTKFTGRGLGLAAVSGIVRAHKGAILVESAPGKGSTFRVVLPVTAASIASHQDKEASAADLTGHGLILVVDDDIGVVQLASNVLETYGYRVLSSIDGREAVDAVRQHGKDISVVLLDMSMPVIGGDEAFRLMREIEPDIPVVFSSGYSDQITGTLLKNARKTAFLQKPYDMRTLAKTIKVMLTAGALLPTRPV